MQQLPRILDSLIRHGVVCSLLFVGLIAPSTAQQQDQQSSQTIVAAGSDEGATEGAPSSDAAAQAAAADAIAQKLSNPVAALISVPIQINYDDNYGPTDKGSVWRTNVQPVIPISLNDDWNMISRTIIPVVKQSEASRRTSADLM